MLPLAHGERAVADVGRRLGPLVTALGDLVLARGHADPKPRDRVEVGGWVGELEGDVVAADGDAAQESLLGGRELGRIVLLGIHRVPGLAAGHDVAGERVLAGGRGITETLPAVLEVVCREGLAVRILEAVAERVGVALPGGAYLGLVLRRGRDRLAGLEVEAHEGLEDPHGDADLLNE